MLLFFWNVLNCTFGTFPFLITQDNNQTKLKPCIVWTPLSFICLLSSGLMLFTTCQIYSTSISQPEKFHCYLFWCGNILIVLHRFMAVKPMRDLFCEIVLHYPLSNFFTYSLKFLMFHVSNVVKTIIFVLTMRSPVLVHFELSLSFFYTMLPCFINMQSIMVCVVLTKKFSEIEHKFSVYLNESHQIEVSKKSIKSQLIFCYKTFNKFLNVYTLDIFLAMSVSFLGACVLFNIVIAITLRFIYWNHYTLTIYMSKMIFFTFHFMSYFLHVMWLSVNASLLKKRVRKFLNGYFNNLPKG